MLDRTIYWLGIVGTAFDALLLARVLLLKLHRIYVFVTLACLLVVLMDVVDIWLWSDAEAGTRVLLYSRFLFVIVYPLAAWDVFEEVKSEVANLRKIATLRLVSGLFFATIFGLLMCLFAPSDSNGEGTLVATLAMVAWAAAAAASLALLWTVNRGMRAQNIQRPHNTAVWLAFWQLTLLGELISCFCILLFPLLNILAGDILRMLLVAYSILITGWCILKLRAVSSGVSSAPAEENL